MTNTQWFAIMFFQSDNSVYCAIPDPFPSTAFSKGLATPDYRTTIASYPGPHIKVFPVRGSGNNSLRMRLIKTAHYP